MKGVDILAQFLTMFPSYMATIKSWEFLGNNTILIGLENGSEVEFGYEGESQYHITQRAG